MVLRRLCILLTFSCSINAFGAGEPQQAATDTYPRHPIHIVAPSSAGGGIDTISRILGPKMTALMGQPIVVDDRPGAGGIIGSQVVARAAPDGYTLMIIASGYTLNPSLYKKLPYDTIKDFERVSLIACAPNMLVVNASLPVHSVSELIAYAKANPNKLTYASSGIGTTSYLSGLLFQQRAGIKMIQVPYKGAGESNMAAVGGAVNLIFSAPHEMIPYVKQGKMRALAVTSTQRLPLVPDIPTLAESGFPGFNVDTCYGMLAPAKTPQPIVQKLNTTLVKILHMPDVSSQLQNLSFRLIGSTPEEYTVWARKEMADWAKSLKAAGIQPQ